MLDAAGLNRATIAVSGDLDESVIQTLVASGAPVDVWGVGTRMVTGGIDPAFSGVYKMAACEDSEGRMRQVMKFSDNPDKTTNPGIKQVWRIRDGRGSAVADVMAQDALGDSGESAERFEVGGRHRFWHPAADYRHFYHVIERPLEPLLKKRLSDGEPFGERPTLAEIRSRSLADFATFDPTYKRHLSPHVYKVSISERLYSIKLDLIKRHFGNMDSPGEL